MYDDVTLCTGPGKHGVRAKETGDSFFARGERETRRRYIFFSKKNETGDCVFARGERETRRRYIFIVTFYSNYTRALTLENFCTEQDQFILEQDHIIAAMILFYFLFLFFYFLYRARP